MGLLAAVGMLLVRRLARRAPALPWVRARLRLALALAAGWLRSPSVWLFVSGALGGGILALDRAAHVTTGQVAG